MSLMREVREERIPESKYTRLRGNVEWDPFSVLPRLQGGIEDYIRDICIG
jgi:hypothetical protein